MSRRVSKQDWEIVLGISADLLSTLTAACILGRLASVGKCGSIKVGEGSKAEQARLEPINHTGV